MTRHDKRERVARHHDSDITRIVDSGTGTAASGIMGNGFISFR